MRQDKKAWAEPEFSEVGCGRPEALLHFVSPLHVVRPGLLSRHALDQVLQGSPETQLLQRVVQPTWTKEEHQLTWRFHLQNSAFKKIKKLKSNLWTPLSRTCGDAEVRLVRGDVMDAVVLAREDDVAVLQEHHPAGKAEVRVGPLVNLIGEGHKDGQRKQVAVPGVDMINLRCD